MKNCCSIDSMQEDERDMTRCSLKYLSFVFLLLSLVLRAAGAEEKGTARRLTTEQLLNHVRAIKDASFQPGAADDSFRDVKCGFGIQAQVKTRWSEFTQVQQAELSTLMKTEVMQCDTIAGHFHIFYDTTGINEPALLDIALRRIPGTAKAYINFVAQIFNHVWDIEVEQMGYSAPPLENGQSFYNIYVKDMTDYGLTTFGGQINGTGVPPRYTSNITIDNDYLESQFHSHGIDGLKVTAAHEFHHAIQIGSYGYWENDVYAYELTSTWFEDVVYTEVNDYYQYLRNYFEQFADGRSFNANPSVGGYERCTWAHFMAKQFGPTMMRKVWEGMGNSISSQNEDVFIKNTAAVFADLGTTLQTAFMEYTKWNYYTADRADTINYYPEGKYYPRFLPLQKIDFYNTASTASASVQALSSSMYEFDMLHDTITAVIANVDFNSAMMRNTTQNKIDVILSSQSLSPPSKDLVNGLKAKIVVDTLALWRSIFMQDSIQIRSVQLSAAPNPFRLPEAQKLILPLHDDNASWADVSIYNSALDLAYSGQLRTSYNENGGTRVIEVPASALQSKLSSGIYFVIAKTINGDYKWKVAVIR
jgi:hypothetical protein